MALSSADGWRDGHVRRASGVSLTDRGSTVRLSRAGGRRGSDRSVGPTVTETRQAVDPTACVVHRTFRRDLDGSIGRYIRPDRRGSLKGCLPLTWDASLSCFSGVWLSIHTRHIIFVTAGSWLP